ncbi:AAA family ATPase [Pseudomonas peradeniyensis]|uniref:ATP-binding protein n=1 Tax=Pseudomonas peradeniyensis TaxID=2745488 RepID=A0ABT2VE42_9PSED|nr:ATP-binding protein [Pseudomonas peradeniyensis]MCU7239986.1 ATP-binding protein [Pseudomonas peradeniyensis]
MIKRLIDVHFDGKQVKLTPEKLKPNINNCYTVIVGKNGIGKSRLLADLITTGNFMECFQKIIAISTSPFDKFPSQRRKSLTMTGAYRYVGMRSEGMYQYSSSVSLISSAAKGLLERLSNPNGSDGLYCVFNALNFEPVADFILKPGYLKSARKDYHISLVEGSSLAIELRRIEREHGIQVDERYFDLLENLPLGRRIEVLDAMTKLNKVLDRRRAVELKADFNQSTLLIDGHAASNTIIQAILVLLDVGLIRLMDLVLMKKGFGQLSLRKASSGEQCLLVLILGIAGHICEHSLILIDEPEISLHPRWQEEFMELLTASFSGYWGCQFVIATHSPQIIARLRGDGCYIASLSRGELYDAADFHDKSADFQLAELFDAPGIMNEYISRLAFNLLAKVKHSKTLDDASRDELKRLLRFNQQLESSDPVKELIRSVAMLCESYANDH